MSSTVTHFFNLDEPVPDCVFGLNRLRYSVLVKIGMNNLVKGVIEEIKILI